MAKRTRRVSPEEEAALIAVASPRLQRLIIGAIETGMRLGELLDLTWRDVNPAEGGGVITVRAETAKDADVRVIPISSKLAGCLERCATPSDTRERESDRHLLEHEDRRAPRIVEAVRRHSWQERDKIRGNRATAS